MSFRSNLWYKTRLHFPKIHSKNMSTTTAGTAQAHAPTASAARKVKEHADNAQGAAVNAAATAAVSSTFP
jgi:hypothetical protein